MTVFVTVDPGKWHAAAAFTLNGDVLAAVDVKASQQHNPAMAAVEVAQALAAWVGHARRSYDSLEASAPLALRLEEPSTEWSAYEERSSAAKKDVPFLMLMNGAIASRFCAGGVHDIRLLPVNEWKGGVPKKAHHQRIWKRLSPTERALFGPRVSFDDKGLVKGVNRDKMDAVGMGLWCAKRISS